MDKSKTLNLLGAIEAAEANPNEIANWLHVAQKAVGAGEFILARDSLIFFLKNSATLEEQTLINHFEAIAYESDGDFLKSFFKETSLNEVPDDTVVQLGRILSRIDIDLFELFDEKLKTDKYDKVKNLVVEALQLIRQKKRVEAIYLYIEALDYKVETYNICEDIAGIFSDLSSRELLLLSEDRLLELIKEKISQEYYSLFVGKLSFKLEKYSKSAALFEMLLDADMENELKNDIFYHLGASYYFINNHEKAIYYLMRAKELGSKNAAIEPMIVGIYYQQGNFKEFYEYVLNNNLDDSGSLSSLISSAIYTSITDDNTLTLDYCERILEIEKDNPIALSLKIASLSKLSRLKEALELATKSLELHSGNLGIIEEVYNIFFKLNLHSSCELALNTALKLHPNNFRVQTKFFLTKKFSCDWEYIAQHSHMVPRIGIIEPSEPFACLSIEDNPFNQLQRSTLYLESRMPAKRIPIKHQAHEKIRIGYFSSDFFEHATMHLMSGLLREHDSNHFDIYIYDFSLYGDDKMSDFVQSAKFQYFNISNIDEESVINLIRDHQLDIALDLKGYTKDSRPRLFTYGLAPIQVNYLGYPSTLGSDHMDYIIADRIIIPEHFIDAYSENIIYLPHSYQPNDNTRPQPKLDADRHDFGLPKDSFVYCSFNQTYKIGLEEIALWAKILHGVKQSVLWLYCPNTELRPKFIELFASYGVDEGRIIFAGNIDNQTHMKRLALADLMLDTFIVNAHTTASDALWMGVPVVTKIGSQFAARVCASLLSASYLEELITRTSEEYVSLAIRLGNDSSYYANIKTKLCCNTKKLPLFDTTTYTRKFELAMKQIMKLSFNDKVEDIYIE